MFWGLFCWCLWVFLGRVLFCFVVDFEDFVFGWGFFWGFFGGDFWDLFLFLELVWFLFLVLNWLWIFTIGVFEFWGVFSILVGAFDLFCERFLLWIFWVVFDYFEITFDFFVLRFGCCEFLDPCFGREFFWFVRKDPLFTRAFLFWISIIKLIIFVLYLCITLLQSSVNKIQPNTINPLLKFFPTYIGESSLASTHWVKQSWLCWACSPSRDLNRIKNSAVPNLLPLNPPEKGDPPRLLNKKLSLSLYKKSPRLSIL